MLSTELQTYQLRSQLDVPHPPLEALIQGKFGRCVAIFVCILYRQQICVFGVAIHTNS